MAFYEGETLKKHVGMTALRPEQAIDIAVQVAQGLVQAHEAGIVHRDIKSANLILTRGGLVKIVDFGLAKLLGQNDLTVTGATVGTAAYMSPDQVRARPVDRRTDIWSLGVVLFEMLTGQLPFEGNGPYQLTHSIVHDQPSPISALRAGVPPELERIVHRCLAKNADERYQNAADLLAELKWLRRESSGEHSHLQFADVQPAASRRESAIGVSRFGTSGATIRQPDTGSRPVRWSRARWALPIGIGLMVPVIGVVLFRARESPVVAPRIDRTLQLTRDAGLEIDPAVSPDGRLMAYAAGPLDQMNIYVQQIEGGRRLSLTDGVPGNHRGPQWSPDGNRIGFQTFRDGRTEIYVVAALGGIPRRLVDAPPGRCVRGLSGRPMGRSSRMSWDCASSARAAATRSMSGRRVAERPGKSPPPSMCAIGIPTGRPTDGISCSGPIAAAVTSCT